MGTGCGLRDFAPGDAVTWTHVPRGGWGYVWRVPARVVSVGRKRVTIDAALRRGGTKRVSVTPGSLAPTDDALAAARAECPFACDPALE